MKQAMRNHLSAYGRIRGFIVTFVRLSDGGKEPAVQEDLDCYCDFCDQIQTDLAPI